MDSTGGDKLGAYEKHRIGDLMFTHSTAKYHHPGFSGVTGELVQITDVLHKVDDETGRAK